MTHVRNPVFARLYHRVLRPGEGQAIEACRRRMLDGLRGDIVEVGAGDGANFALYPPSVRRVTAFEPEPYLRDQASRAARSVPVRIDVLDAVAERLPLPAGSADAVVFSLVLCSVPDPGAALAEARRVLRPDGELRVLEHVVADHRAGRAVQRALQATVWPVVFGGCHPARDTLAAIRAAGFDTTRLERFTVRTGAAGPPMPVLLGAAQAAA